MLHDVEPVADQLLLISEDVLPDRGEERVPQVERHHLDGGPPFEGKASEDRQCLLLPSLAPPLPRRLLEVVDQGRVVRSVSHHLFVDPPGLRREQGLCYQTPDQSPLLNASRLVLAGPEKLGGR